MFILALFAAGWPSEGHKRRLRAVQNPDFSGIANPAFDSSRSNAAQIP
jgi:hypothetical protein